MKYLLTARRDPADERHAELRRMQRAYYWVVAGCVAGMLVFAGAVWAVTP